MNISVFKDNQSVVEVNLGAEVLGNLDAEATFFVGRSPECHVHLDDKQISREHAEISYAGGNWNIKQLSPFSKVVVNGTPYENKQLSAGDIITVGPYVLNVAIEEAAPAVEAAEDAVVEEPEAQDEELIEDFDEETVAMDSDEVDELGDEELAEVEDSEFDDELGDTDDDFGSDDEFEVSEDSDDEFSSDEDFEGDVEEMEAADDGDEDLFGGDDDSDNAGFDSSEDFAVEEYDDDDDSDESTRVIQTFAKVELEIFGEYAPYEKYVVDSPEVTIGRDPEKCQIVLNDPEVSGTHAVLRKNNITCTIEDLDSGNGTLINGERTNKSILTNGDEIVIGGTTFTVRISSDFLQEEEQRLMPVEENQVVEVEEVVEVDADFDDELLEVAEGEEDTGKQSIIADIKNYKNLPPDRKKKVNLILGGLLLLGLLLMGEDDKPKTTVKKKEGRESMLLDKSKSPTSKKKQLLKKLTKEQQEFVESRYLLAKEQVDVGKYREAITELDKIFNYVQDYKQAKQLYAIAKEGFKEQERLEEQRRKEREEKIRKAKVEKLVKTAREAVKEKQIERARSLFSSIMSLDPENFDVPQMKEEIDAYEKKLQAEAMAKAEKEAERNRQIDMLAPGKNFYLNKKWHSAILKLQDFVKKKGIDEDLMAEGSKMLSESKENLDNIIQPLLGKARSLKEGQDLKGAYETYLEIIKFDPSSAEALDESNEIRERLKNRSKKIYREAIIAESLSLFEDAKEKFQEVQQVSPSDSEYYKKATEKLKDYLD